MYLPPLPPQAQSSVEYFTLNFVPKPLSEEHYLIEADCDFHCLLDLSSLRYLLKIFLMMVLFIQHEPKQ